MDPMIICDDANSVHPQRRTAKGKITTEQWDAAKGLIHWLYMDENKPFPYVADILRKDYGFFPT